MKYNDKSEQRYIIFLHIAILCFDRSEIAPWEYENLSNISYRSHGKDRFENLIE
jgi:hypothetical protein